MENIKGKYKREYLGLVWEKKYLEDCVYVRKDKQPYDEYNVLCICCGGSRGVYQWYKTDGQLAIFNKVPMYRVPCDKLIKLMDLEELDEQSKFMVAAKQLEWCKKYRKKIQPWMLTSKKLEIED